ncbi:MAG: PEP-CTERM sorting domain-containing protein [Verrucomicrobia bacterium]|nr:PEP-CTERM sorting domain-containing protein [Verrucomicrobiota bacterium]
MLDTVDGTAIASSAESYANLQWYLILANITINPAAADSISLWLFTSMDNVPGSVASLGMPVVSTSMVDWGDSVSNVWVGGYRGPEGGSGISTNDIDALRISSAGGDAGLQQVLTAIPEPSTYAAFLGLLALGCVVLRRLR